MLKVHPVISKLRVRVTRGGMMNPERIRQSIFCIVGQAYLCQRVRQDEGTTRRERRERRGRRVQRKRKKKTDHSVNAK